MPLMNTKLKLNLDLKFKLCVYEIVVELMDELDTLKATGESDTIQLYDHLGEQFMKNCKLIIN